MVAEEAAKISKSLRKKYGYKTSGSTSDFFFQEYQEPERPNTETSGYPIQVGGIRMNYCTSKNRCFEVKIFTHEYKPAENVGSQQDPVWTENTIKKIDEEDIKGYYTNCYADALGLVGNMDDLQFQFVLEDDYTEIKDIKDAQVGDIFYSNPFEGGIGHAMTLIEIKIVDGKKIAVFKSNYQFSEIEIGALDEIKEKQKVTNFKKGLHVYRKKR